MSVLLRAQLPDLVLEDALPALEFILQEEHEAFQARTDMIFQTRDMRSSIAQSTQVSSLQPAGIVGEGEQIPMQKLAQGFDKTYTAVKYAIMMGSSQELIDDLEFEVMAQNPRRLMRAFESAREIASADVLNSGFSTTGPDGVALFSASHPLLAPGAGLGSNLLTAADLSTTSLKAIITLLRQTPDSAGNKVMIAPAQLIVTPSNEFLAHELLKSVMLVDSSNANVNAVNSVGERYRIEPVVWDYLTDDDAFFVASGKLDHNLVFYWRKRPEVSSEQDFKTEVALTKLSGRFAVGYSDWRGIVGSAGV